MRRRPSEEQKIRNAKMRAYRAAIRKRVQRAAAKKRAAARAAFLAQQAERPDAENPAAAKIPA